MGYNGDVIFKSATKRFVTRGRALRGGDQGWSTWGGKAACSNFMFFSNCLKSCRVFLVFSKSCSTGQGCQSCWTRAVMSQWCVTKSLSSWRLTLHLCSWQLVASSQLWIPMSVTSSTVVSCRLQSQSLATKTWWTVVGIRPSARLNPFFGISMWLETRIQTSLKLKKPKRSFSCFKCY